jgi:septal ring factor EnvC (AmiA/AmiB activator)
MDKKIKKMSDDIDVLDNDLAKIKDNYAKSMQNQQQEYRTTQHKLLMILSAENLSQSYRRLRYLREYAGWQKEESDRIVKKQDEILLRKSELEKSRKEKQDLFTQRENENKIIQEEEKLQQKEVRDLNTKQKDLQRTLEQKQKETDALNNQIEKLISEEIAEKNKQEALAEAKTKETSTSTKTTGSESSKTTSTGTSSTGTAPSNTTSSGTTSSGTTPSGTASSGTASAGTASTGTTSTGTTSAGTASAGTTSSGTVSSGTTSSGTAPAGTTSSRTASTETTSAGTASSGNSSPETASSETATSRTTSAGTTSARTASSGATSSGTASSRTATSGASTSGAASKTAETTSSPAKNNYSSLESEAILTKNFTDSKGKLPFPLTGRYTVISSFGEHQHQELSYVRTNNNGIDIQSAAGAEARAIFKGVVTRVFIMPGYNNSVIIRHGDYLTVYSNLVSVYVNAGDIVTSQQTIGRVFTDTEKGNETILHFQIWKERTKLNPSAWLR